MWRRIRETRLLNNPSGGVSEKVLHVPSDCLISCRKINRLFLSVTQKRPGTFMICEWMEERYRIYRRLLALLLVFSHLLLMYKNAQGNFGCFFYMKFLKKGLYAEGKQNFLFLQTDNVSCIENPDRTSPKQMKTCRIYGTGKAGTYDVFVRKQ